MKTKAVLENKQTDKPSGKIRQGKKRTQINKLRNEKGGVPVVAKWK